MANHVFETAAVLEVNDSDGAPLFGKVFLEIEAFDHDHLAKELAYVVRLQPRFAELIEACGTIDHGDSSTVWH